MDTALVNCAKGFMLSCSSTAESAALNQQNQLMVVAVLQLLTSNNYQRLVFCLVDNWFCHKVRQNPLLFTNNDKS
jgi:hypothetical protein